MADSFNKKERDKKRKKRKKDKAERKAQRKLEGKTTEEFMYLDEDGNLLDEPENYQEYLFDGGKAFEFDSSIARWKNKCKQYQKALNQATEIVNYYGGNK